MVPKGGLEPPTGFPNTPPQKVGSHIAPETGQHSLATLLLQNGYRLELERYAPLDLALRSRRWDLFDLLLDRGGDIRKPPLPVLRMKPESTET